LKRYSLFFSFKKKDKVERSKPYFKKMPDFVASKNSIDLKLRGILK
jgi:hypothetical protein